MNLSDHFRDVALNDFWSYVRHHPSPKVIYTLGQQDRCYAENQVARDAISEYSSILLDRKMIVCEDLIKEVVL